MIVTPYISSFQISFTLAQGSNLSITEKHIQHKSIPERNVIYETSKQTNKQNKKNHKTKQKALHNTIEKECLGDTEFGNEARIEEDNNFCNVPGLPYFFILFIFFCIEAAYRLHRYSRLYSLKHTV